MCYLLLGAYPELFALVGGTVPDFRGLFLRGHGGNSAGLGVRQEDAGRNVSGYFGFGSDTFVTRFGGESVYQYESSRGKANTGNDSYGGPSKIGIDASRQWGNEHTANEFRPKNIAVRYFIRARS